MGRAAAGVLGNGWRELELASGYSGPQVRAGDGRARKTLDSPKIIKASEGSVLSAPGTHGKHGKAKVSFFSYRR